MKPPLRANNHAIVEFLRLCPIHPLHAYAEVRALQSILVEKLDGTIRRLPAGQTVGIKPKFLVPLGDPTLTLASVTPLYQPAPTLIPNPHPQR